MKNSEVINEIGEIRNDLFDKVSLSLSRVAGQISFLNGESIDGKKFIAEGHSQVVGLEVQEEIAQIRKEVSDLSRRLMETREEILFSWPLT